MTTRDYVWLIAESVSFLAVLLVGTWICFKAAKGIADIVRGWGK